MNFLSFWGFLIAVSHIIWMRQIGEVIEIKLSDGSTLTATGKMAEVEAAMARFR